MTGHAQAARETLAVIFDGDDTLWSTEQLYDDARAKARHIVTESGFDGALWEKHERRIDVQNVAKFGYGPERFPTSCVQAYEQLCRDEGRELKLGIAQQIRCAASSVFQNDPPLVPRVRETLEFLRSKGARLALLTKGDRSLQLRRMERSGLLDLFDAVEIVPEKSPDVIRQVVSSLGVKPNSAWMVGNSIRSDVLPAIEAGLRAVWVRAHVWEYERALDEATGGHSPATERLTDVPALIAP
jgi:putative hydrolase of the HAD superfamily